MDECVQRLRGLIDDLLDVTGLETGRLKFAPRAFDLVEPWTAPWARAPRASMRPGFAS